MASLRVTICAAHTEAASVLYFQALTLELLMDIINFLHDENTRFWVNLAPINASFNSFPPPSLQITWLLKGIKAIDKGDNCEQRAIG